MKYMLNMLKGLKYFVMHVNCIKLCIILHLCIIIFIFVWHIQNIGKLKSWNSTLLPLAVFEKVVYFLSFDQFRNNDILQHDKHVSKTFFRLGLGGCQWFNQTLKKLWLVCLIHEKETWLEKRGGIRHVFPNH